MLTMSFSIDIFSALPAHRLYFSLFPSFSLSLPPQDLLGLHKEKLWGDDEWSMISLLLPSSVLRSSPGLSGSASSGGLVQASTHSVPTGHKSGKRAAATAPFLIPHTSSTAGTMWAGGADCEKEMGRLRTERAFLLQRVQMMARTLDRRAEGIQAYFEDELKRVCECEPVRCEYDNVQCVAGTTMCEGLNPSVKAKIYSFSFTTLRLAI